MAAVEWGTTPITDIRHGLTTINEVRHGTTLVWQRSMIYDDFDRDDYTDLGNDWSYPQAADYEIGVENGQARLAIPEGLIGAFFSLTTSRGVWWQDQNSGDDGYVECRPSSLGSGKSAASPTGYRTMVFGRSNNEDTLDDGVGIELMAGNCWITSRISESDNREADGGSFQPGDTLRLTFTNYTFVLERNGATVATWEDGGTTTRKGSTYRSLSLRMDGAKDVLGPRRFSPALDYVMMG